MGDPDKIKQVFKELFSKELSSAEVKGAKKDLIAQFSPAAKFDLKPAVLIPVLSLIFAVLMVYQLNLPKPKQKIKEIPVSQVAVKESVGEKVQKVQVKSVTKQIEKIFRTEVPLDVKVTRVSSDVGSAMVFQKKYQETPVTIVWVFTGGANQ